MVDMECMLQGTSSNMVLKLEVISLLHHTRAKEHVVTASMAYEMLLSTVVRCELDPLSNFVHASLELYSELALNTLSFLLPVNI